MAFAIDLSDSKPSWGAMENVSRYHTTIAYMIDSWSKKRKQKNTISEPGSIFSFDLLPLLGMGFHVIDESRPYNCGYSRTRVNILKLGLVGLKYRTISSAGTLDFGSCWALYGSPSRKRLIGKTTNGPLPMFATNTFSRLQPPHQNPLTLAVLCVDRCQVHPPTGMNRGFAKVIIQYKWL